MTGRSFSTTNLPAPTNMPSSSALNLSSPVSKHVSIESFPSNLPNRRGPQRTSDSHDPPNSVLFASLLPERIASSSGVMSTTPV
ncbi:MAG: hypothetical protein Q9193_001515 [Seirophora villosa]